jgi:hypothetical protein
LFHFFSEEERRRKTFIFHYFTYLTQTFRIQRNWLFW